MNVHHLELFYYVARHGGISAAARQIPYGIQQPAISLQIMQLEDALATTLFHRRPFQLTPTGETLFRFIEPFFGGLGEVERVLRGGAAPRLRIGCPETVQREYLPAVLRALRKRIPGLQFSLVSGRLEQIEQRLLAQDIDVGISALIGKRPEGVKEQELIRLPMALAVPEKSGFSAAEKILERDRIDVPLVSLPASEPMCRLFQQELRKRSLEWPASLELGSLELVSRYVAEGYGVGLTVDSPALHADGVRLLPLADFPKVPFGIIWMGSLSSAGDHLVEAARAVALRMMGQ
jgi:DNA-binding transcriptional LysR family regulator